MVSVSLVASPATLLLVNVAVRNLILLSVIVGLLSSCASAPKFDTAGVDRGLTPGAAADRGANVVGTRIQWGGVIVATRNLPQSTQLEVLAYPLERNGEPDTTGTPRGRFLLVEDGYLEPVDYAPGRAVTAVGTVTGVEQGRVGEADYRYPVVDAAQLHLWPKQAPYRRRDPNVHFGIGVILH